MTLCVRMVKGKRGTAPPAPRFTELTFGEQSFNGKESETAGVFLFEHNNTKN